ncbi:transglutaminase domain-containing protein [Alteromonas gracilis]
MSRVRPTDLALPVVLSLASLIPLTSTYAGSAWWVLGVVGAVTGSMLVGVLAGRRWGPPVLPLAVVAAYVVVGVPLTSRRTGLASLVPTSTSLGDLARGSATAWRDLIGTIPLVDGAGPPLLVPFMLTLLPAATSAALAVGARHPVVPSLPPLAGLVLAFMVGRGDVEAASVGVAFALVSLAWAVLRQEQRGGVAAGVASLAMLLLATGIALVGPAPGGDVEPRLLRENLAGGFDTTQTATLLDGFRRYSRPGPDSVDNVHRRRLLLVRDAEPGLRLRFVALDHYDGTRWRPNPDVSPEASADRFLRVGPRLDNPTDGEPVAIGVDVLRAWRSAWVPTAGSLQEIDFAFHPDRPDPRAELRYNLATDTALLPRRLGPRDDYYLRARRPDQDLVPGLGTGADVDPETLERSEFVADIAAGFAAAYDDEVEALLAAAASLKQRGRYSDGEAGFERRFPDGHDVERLGSLFLYAPQIVGNDEQYAATMALIATRLGFPARVVVGAEVPRSGVVRGRDVEAWVEVQVADGSWRTLETRTFMGSRPPRRVVRDRPAAQPGAAPLVPPPVAERQRPRTTPPPVQEPPASTTTPEAGSGEHPPWWLLLLALPGVVPTVKLARRRRRRTTGSPALRVAGGWDELVDAVRDHGVARVPAGTRPQQAASWGSAGALAVLADDAVFAPDEPPREDVEAFWGDVARERAAVVGDLPWWRRVWAWFNPRSLRRP